MQYIHDIQKPITLQHVRLFTDYVAWTRFRYSPPPVALGLPNAGVLRFHNVTSARWRAPILEGQDIFVQHLPQNLSGTGGDTVTWLRVRYTLQVSVLSKCCISRSPLIETHVVTCGQRSILNII